MLRGAAIQVPIVGAVMTTTTRRAILIVTVAAVAVWAWGRWESPKQRAYRICAECADLTPPDVDGLIAAVRLSNRTREQNLELYHRGTFAALGDAADCEPCALAVLDAAGK